MSHNSDNKASDCNDINAFINLVAKTAGDDYLLRNMCEFSDSSVLVSTQVAGFDKDGEKLMKDLRAAFNDSNIKVGLKGDGCISIKAEGDAANKFYSVINDAKLSVKIDDTIAASKKTENKASKPAEQQAAPPETDAEKKLRESRERARERVIEYRKAHKITPPEVDPQKELAKDKINDLKRKEAEHRASEYREQRKNEPLASKVQVGPPKKTHTTASLSDDVRAAGKRAAAVVKQARSQIDPEVERIKRIVDARKGLLMSKPGDAQKNDATATFNMKKSK